jgi:hypothetical protein
LLRDRRADGCTNSCGSRTQFDHGSDRILEHAAMRTAPTGMGSADHTGLGVMEQYRRAVGGYDA